MVTRGVEDWEQHKKDVYNKIVEMYDAEGYNQEGHNKALEFINHYASKYDAQRKPSLHWKLAWHIYSEYKFVQNRSGVAWYGFFGPGGAGKTTLASNVAYFFDSTFTFKDRCFTDVKKFAKKFLAFPMIDANKALLLDEPDNRIHTNSREGKILKMILGKARQQKIFLLFCATDLKDIPPFIIRKLSGGFYVKRYKNHRVGYFFKNDTQRDRFILQEIQYEYREKGWYAFTNRMKKATLKFTCLNNHVQTEEDKELYISKKAKDYQETIQELIKEEKKVKTLDKRDQVIFKMKEKGLKQVEIAELTGVTQARVNQILNNKRA